MKPPTALQCARFANLMNEATHAFYAANFARCRELLATANIQARELHLDAAQERQRGVEP